LHQLGWITPEALLGSRVLRVPHAYPVYDLDYAGNLAAVCRHLAQWPRLHLLGRTGSFRYLNSDGVIEAVLRIEVRLLMCGFCQTLCIHGCIGARGKESIGLSA